MRSVDRNGRSRSVGHLLPHGLDKEDSADGKHEGQGAHAQVYAAGELAHGGDGDGAQEGGTLAADVVQAEVLAGLLRGMSRAK